jgi:hypothetical protein
MNTYPLTGVPLPEMVYSLYHQPRSSGSVEEYTDTMLRMHERVLLESEKLEDIRQKSSRELLLREAQMLRGALSQFLETPIRSDNAEIQRIVSDTLTRLQDQLLPQGRAGVEWSTEGMIVHVNRGPADIRKSFQAGMAMLAGLGFAVKSSSRPVFESQFVFHGGTNIDRIEHIVRDRIGINSSVHGEHVEQSAGFVSSLANLVTSVGSVPAPKARTGVREILCYFNKPQGEYEPFRTALTTLGDALYAGGQLHALSVWQRKLGLGRGEEFLLRALLKSADSMPEFMKSLQSLADQPPLSDAFGAETKALLRELV